MQKTTDKDDKKKPKKKLSFRTPESEVFRVRRWSAVAPISPPDQYICSSDNCGDNQSILTYEPHQTNYLYKDDSNDEFELEV